MSELAAFCDESPTDLHLRSLLRIALILNQFKNSDKVKQLRPPSSVDAAEDYSHCDVSMSSSVSLKRVERR